MRVKTSVKAGRSGGGSSSQKADTEQRCPPCALGSDRSEGFSVGATLIDLPASTGLVDRAPPGRAPVGCTGHGMGRRQGADRSPGEMTRRSDVSFLCAHRL